MRFMEDDSDTILHRLRAELAPMRGLWHGMESDLLRLGIASLRELRGKQPDAIAESYRGLSGHPPDPVLVPYFAALIGYAETGVATPWWYIMRRDVQTRTC
jgi:hypothetical protein